MRSGDQLHDSLLHGVSGRPDMAMGIIPDMAMGIMSSRSLSSVMEPVRSTGAMVRLLRAHLAHRATPMQKVVTT